ncbi:phosphatase PAP2 family protein [Alginatibacterium sediminis]|uniref:undecaprenyl-diphosphate phosphatase n=1 Tax=Alginatibacterium sediminis TaxID=2164068 RepID=A0A420ELA4_9ALTE|nr:phosphatase PAP2 family protein [Alginatibacterium sediminis]RKF21386.1 phosphatase PAP2 family protein [Alginatibacterium sediminis]
MRDLIVNLDYAFSARCLQHRFNRHVAYVSKWISHAGDGYLYVLLVVLTYCYADRGVEFIVLASKSFVVELGLYLSLKQLFRRDRPKQLPVFIKPSDRFSFPSGHSAGAFVMAACVDEVFPAFSVLAFTCSSLIACSRVLLGVHFISDVIAGALLGLCVVWMVV